MPANIKSAEEAEAGRALSDRAADLPFVSIIMPVRNEADFIERSLGSALSQDYPHERLEIIVSDGASTDSTLNIIDKLASETDISITVVQNEKRIAPSGLNAAIARARGEVYVRVDGHCEIEPNYVSNCVELLTSGKADGVGGPIETIGVGLQAEAISIAMSSKFGVGGSAFRTVNDREMYADTVAFPGYTRGIVERVGPFNEELVRNQDDEYNYRIRKLGGRILLSPRIRSKYYSRSTFRSLWSQYFQYGYWKVRVFQLHPRQLSLRQFVPLCFVLSIAALIILSLFVSSAVWLLVVAVGTYLSTTLFASLIAARARISIVPQLFLSFCILHLSYGLGSIVGLIAFRDRWGEPKVLEPSASNTSVR